MAVETKLPDKPSELIRLAIKDLETCEKDPDYHINMDTWHYWDRFNNICEVCVSGALMACSLGMNKTVSAWSGSSPADQYQPEESVKRKLTAINLFRQGAIVYAMEDLGLKTSLEPERRVAFYDQDPDQMKKDMLAIADDLEKEGN